MDIKFATEVLHRLRQGGFRLAPLSWAEESTDEQMRVVALMTSAHILYGVSPKTFDRDGKWGPVGDYVRHNGLVPMTVEESSEMAFNAIEQAAINVAIEMAKTIVDSTAI